MAEHEAVKGKQGDSEQKHRTRQPESGTSVKKSLAWDEGKLALTGTPFVPRMAEHAAIISRTVFPEQNHEYIMRMQQTYGNRYVQRLLKSIKVQAKLTVNAPDDAYEQEADRVAERVVRSVNRQVQRQPEEEEELQAKPVLQRQDEEEEEEEIQAKPVLHRQDEEEEEEEEEIQAKPVLQSQEDEEEEELQTKLVLQRQPEEEEEEVQARAADKEASPVSRDLETRINKARGSGQPLLDDVRIPMEQAFGADFKSVRVHTSGEAAQLNRKLSAQAFTSCHDIFFGANKYDPGSSVGKQLLAHELTHVVQQTGQVQRVETDKSRPTTVVLANVQFQGKEEPVQAKPSRDAYRGPTLGASITTMGKADGIQRVPLFDNSQIDYDPTLPTPHLTWGRTTKDITVVDYNTLTGAITTLIANNVDPDSIEKQMTKYFDVGGVGHAEAILEFDLVTKQIASVAARMPAVDLRRIADEAVLRGGPAGANPPITAGPSLLAAGDNFQAYELAGADPHRGGEIPLFLRYQTASGAIKKIVYKPADLTPERVLFGGHEFSVAQFGGTNAAPGAAGIGGVYSYMTFINEEGPRNAADVRGIYHSLGEGLALGYVYGLRDLHHENYMLRRDHIQWIDLEAMTSTFDSMAAMDILRLFNSIGEKMVSTLRAGIEPGPKGWFLGLKRQANRKRLIRDLGAINYAQEITNGFNAKRGSIPATATQAAQWVTRFVPFATAELYNLVSSWHDKPEMTSPGWPPGAWAGLNPEWYDRQLRMLTYSGPRNEVEPLITAQATRAAIHRGDIPFFLRRGDAILDEQGQVIIPHSGHPRVPHQTAGHTAEQQAANDIQARRTGPLPANLLAYPINMVRGMHTSLMGRLSR